jgi:alpha-galactosidase
MLAAGAGICRGEVYVHSGADGRSWSIGNELIERAIRYDDAGGLRTEKLSYKVTGRDYAALGKGQPGAADEFSFTSGQKQINGKSARFQSAQVQQTNSGKTLDIQLEESASGLEIHVLYTVYDGYAAIRKRLKITNHGTRASILTRMTAESLAAGPGTPAEINISAGYGAIPRELFFTGRVSDAAIFLRNSLTGEGMAVLNEAPGYLKRTEIGEWWRGQIRVMYDTDLFPFEYALAPGASFESAASSLVLFQDGHGFDDPHWTVPRFVANVLARRPAGTGAPWVYNTWEPFFRDVDQKALEESTPVAKRIGIDIFTIDDGWQAQYGANDVSVKNFPGGMPAIRSLLEKNSLKLGLWIPLAAISTETSEYRNHPEWACRNQDGTPKFTSTAAGRSAVMCLASGYRDAAVKRILALIEEAHPAYLKIDLTTVFNAYGEQPGCYAKGHFHGNWAQSLQGIYAGLDYVGKKIYEKHPEVLIDYTFELWGEKHLIDPALLQAADLDWLSNVSDAAEDEGGPLHARSLLYPRALSIPAETMLIGNLRAPVPSIEEHFATVIGSAPLLMGDLRKLSDGDQQWYAERIQAFKNLRQRAALTDSFFPLGHWEAPQLGAIDGFARLSRTGDGLLVLFRNRSKTGDFTAKVLAPAGATYEAHSLITGATIGTVSAQELQDGWPVHFAGDHPTEVLELRRTNKAP